MRKLKQYLRKIWKRLFGRSELQGAYRQQAKFRKRYPKYELGVDTYGLPIVHDWNEGTTYASALIVRLLEMYRYF